MSKSKYGRNSCAARAARKRGRKSKHGRKSKGGRKSKRGRKTKHGRKMGRVKTMRRKRKTRRANIDKAGDDYLTEEEERKFLMY